MRKEIREFKDVKDKRLRLLQQPSCAFALSCSYAAFVHDSVFVATQWLFVHAPHAFVLALRVFVLLCNFRATPLLSCAPALFPYPAVEPGEEGALPEDAVLGFEHPVVLVGVEEQLGFDAFHAGGIEGAHALGGIDAVVFLAVDAEDGGVPLVNKAVGRVGE